MKEKNAETALRNKKSRRDNWYFLLHRERHECDVISKIVINLQYIIVMVAKMKNNAEKIYREKY